MNLLLLGRGKTGALVAEVARERRHNVTIAGAKENSSGAALTPDALKNIDTVIDFTAPHCVIANIEACVRAGKNMIVGTTGWYSHLDRIRDLVAQHNTGFGFAANFSIGVNLFLDIARASAAALRHNYSGQIFERHHATKKDAPSGTAIALQNVIRDASRAGEMGPGSRDPLCSSVTSVVKDATPDAAQSAQLEITSFREGEVIGLHEVVFESPADRIYLCHDAKSRRGFAEGAVRAAEWLATKKGFYDFKEIWREL